ncbi:hypothetical protein [Thermomonas carbonis]|uniref:Uncharacterized protein n=2 Tax=Thermomonas carbonis TaxID=1463158 RepID=A0A7G9SLP9_9GAMM|nr:hypothetical protein [Thermomonas carbonis]QNN68774.1 hypothetical protein H9L16_08440 [Thermomonas carbonis]
MPETPASRWLPSAEVRRWWDARQASLEQACRHAELSVIPQLTLQTGGGRGNTTLYRLDFLPLPAIDDTSDDRLYPESRTATSGLVEYQVEPAKAAWWLRPILGKQPFRMRSWRGYLLVGATILEALALLLLWFVAFVTMRGSRPLSAGDLSYLLTAAALSYLWVQAMRPLIRLPADRVTIANDILLAYDQFHGQFKLVRDAKSKLAGGWFQLVRHHASCSICSGDVEIADGGEAFPGRLIGRCSDSPLEHAFSFDPVTLRGRSLYPDFSPDPHGQVPLVP